MKTLVFAGSTRQQSFNRRLAAVAAQAARDLGADVTLLELADFELPLYNGDLEAQGTPDKVRELKAIVHAHPAWIICSPEYNASYTGLLKNTLDWLSAPSRATPTGPWAPNPSTTRWWACWPLPTVRWAACVAWASWRR